MGLFKVDFDSLQFEPEFISGFSTLYANSNSCVNNGFFTIFFDVSKSCRQSDPLSIHLGSETIGSSNKDWCLNSWLTFKSNRDTYQYVCKRYFTISQWHQKLVERKPRNSTVFSQMLRAENILGKTEPVWLGHTKAKPRLIEENQCNGLKSLTY